MKGFDSCKAGFLPLRDGKPVRWCDDGPLITFVDVEVIDRATGKAPVDGQGQPLPVVECDAKAGWIEVLDKAATLFCPTHAVYRRIEGDFELRLKVN